MKLPSVAENIFHEVRVAVAGAGGVSVCISVYHVYLIVTQETQVFMTYDPNSFDQIFSSLKVYFSAQAIEYKQHGYLTSW